jgi:ABC-2 type transport system permease protein
VAAHPSWAALVGVALVCLTVPRTPTKLGWPPSPTRDNLPHTAAASIAAAIGLVLVVPIVLSIVYGVTQAMWARNVDSLLPGSAGGRMYAYVPSQAAPVTKGLITLDPTQGTLLLVAWVVVIFVVAAVLLKRRDA